MDSQLIADKQFVACGDYLGLYREKLRELI
jgi:hypothetical protein